MTYREMEERTKEIVEELALWPKIVQIKFLTAWLTRVGPDTAFLDQVVREAQTACATKAYTQNDNSDIKKWMREQLEEAETIGLILTPTELAKRCLGNFRISSAMEPYYIGLAQEEKNRKYARDNKRRERANKKTGGTTVAPGAAAELVAAPFQQQKTVTVSRDEQRDHEANEGSGKTPAVTEAIDGAEAAATHRGGGQGEVELPSQHDWNDLNRFIEPYEDTIPVPVYEGLSKAVDFICEYGKCSSIFRGCRGADREWRDFYHVPELLEGLQEVSLLDHTYQVVASVVDIINEEHIIAKNEIVPQALAMTLLHDAGKVPFLEESKLYRVDTTGDHVYGGAEKLKDIFVEAGLPRFTEILEAIETHHRKTGDQNMWAKWLCEAEKRARELEVQRRAGFTPCALEEWLDVSELLQALKPKLNTVFRRRDQLFSVYDRVFCSPDVLHATALRLMSKKRIFDIRLIRDADRGIVLGIITDKLRAAGCIHGEIKPHRFGRSFWVSFRTPRIPDRDLHLLPLKLSALGMTIAEADSMKEGASSPAKFIADVRSLNGGR